MKNLFISLFFIIISLSPAYSDIYKYQDDNGVTHFTNIPDNDNYEKIISEPVPVGNNSYNHIISSKSNKYNIEPGIIKAVITAESNWDHRAVSRKGAIGLMQLMPSTAGDMKINDPFDPEDNIEGGTRYLRYLLDRFDNDLDLALAAYNAGPSRVERAGGIPSITETRMYVKSVKSFYEGISKNKLEKIYKIILNDGTVLYTNTPTPYKHCDSDSR